MAFGVSLYALFIPCATSFVGGEFSIANTIAPLVGCAVSDEAKEWKVGAARLFDFILQKNCVNFARDTLDQVCATVNSNLQWLTLPSSMRMIEQSTTVLRWAAGFGTALVLQPNTIIVLMFSSIFICLASIFPPLSAVWSQVIAWLAHFIALRSLGINIYVVPYALTIISFILHCASHFVYKKYFTYYTEDSNDGSDSTSTTQTKDTIVAEEESVQSDQDDSLLKYE